MTVTVAEVMREVNNLFPAWEMKGTWQIRNGQLTPDDLLLDGEWIGICESVRNDGIHAVTTADGRTMIPDGRNETWSGSIWLLSPPAEFLRLCEEISAWEEAHPAMDKKRESFGAYAVEWVTDRNGLRTGWRDVFEARLRPWRKPWMIW